ncbi:hypothetical protein G7Y89_g7929 [Cudoniella acicularis]|uniref:Cytochrome P450 n=1 Tax=Cudoniella acicularis TaxID=354080 RepID=A0A8H4RHI0_9HELO|nr:hypothetical protein G7Y89_g7929 [Cudoniella acicularis]
MLFENISLIQVAATTISIYLTCWIIYCRFFHPLRATPGPFLASISRVWIVLKTMRGDMEHTQRALHKKHGFLVRIAPNEVICSDPEAIKVIYSTKTVFQKTDFYDAWIPPNNGYPGHFPTRDEKAHSERRRIVNNVYSMTSVLQSEKSIDSCTQLFCGTMSEFSEKEKVVDLSLWVNFYAFDVVGELFYGKMFGVMKERKDISNIMKVLEFILPTFTVGGVLPSYLAKLYIFSSFLFSPSARGALGAATKIQVATETAVGTRMKEIEESKDDKRDMLRKLVEINVDRGEKINFTLGDIVVESQTAVFAGADTTAAAINSILYHLMRNPTAYKKLTVEIDAAVTAGTLSIPVAYSEAIKLPYLKGCVNEGMRLHPSVGFAMQRVVPTGGAIISGFYFPEGYHVGINPAVVQYDKEVFGPDAENYNPERWIEPPEGCDLARMDKTMIQFGAGSRTCIGKNISLSEIYKLVPQLVRLFHIRLADPSKEWKTHNYWFNKQTDIQIYIEERSFR